MDGMARAVAVTQELLVARVAHTSHTAPQTLDDPAWPSKNVKNMC